MNVVVAGVEGIEAALRDAVPDIRLALPDPSDHAALTAAVAGASLAVLSRDAWQSLIEGGGAPEIPVICCIDPATPPVELRRLTEAGVQRLMFQPVDAPELVREVRRVAGRGEARRDGAPPDPAAAPSPVLTAPGLPSGIAAIWAEFRGTMLERLALLESLGSALLEGTRDPAALEAARTAAHKLHGALGTFGSARGSELAAELEAIIAAGAPKQGDVFRYTELVVALRAAVETVDAAPLPESADVPGGDAAGSAGGRSGPVRVVVLDRDPGRTEAIAAGALARGWEPLVAGELDQVMKLVAERSPDVMILDPGASDPERLDAWLRRLALYPPRIPVLFWSGESGLPERLRAAALGVRAFVERDRGAPAVLQRAAALVEAGDAAGTVLVVDDDPATVALTAAALEGTALRVVGLTDPLGFWETVDSVHPDLLLLDMNMPHVSGLQLCRMVRASARWGHLPIIFFTARGDREAMTQAFRSGADDYVLKPVVGPELRGRVLSRLERLRLLRGGAAAGVGSADDAAAGASVERSAAVERVAASLAIAARSRHPLTLAVVRLRGPDPDDDVRVPLSRVAGVLREAARPEDVVAVWSDVAIVACLYGMTREEAGAWVDARIRPRADDRWTSAVGTAVFPGDGTTVAALVERAARRAEGADEGPDGESRRAARVDVVLVEDDDALAALLLHTFAARGLTAHWIGDGVEAVRVLAGRRPQLTARVMLLDIGLPGLDGLTVLKRLAESGVTDRTPVVMLTARAGEAEVLRSLELGAFDHVPKPFSVAELLHRLRRALDAGERAT